MTVSMLRAPCRPRHPPEIAETLRALRLRGAAGSSRVVDVLDLLDVLIAVVAAVAVVDVMEASRMTDATQDPGQPTAAPLSSKAAPPKAAPPEVDRLAGTRGLGEYITARHGVSPSRALATGAAIAAIALAFLIVLSGPVSNASVFPSAYSVLHAVYLGFLFMLVAGVGQGIRGLVAGAQAHYLYAGGVVHTRRSVARAVAWQDVIQLRSIHRRRGDRPDVGEVVGYRLEARDGTSIVIPLVLTEGRDAFVDRIVAALRTHNRPIV